MSDEALDDEHVAKMLKWVNALRMMCEFATLMGELHEFHCALTNISVEEMSGLPNADVDKILGIMRTEITNIQSGETPTRRSLQ